MVPGTSMGYDRSIYSTGSTSCPEDPNTGSMHVMLHSHPISYLRPSFLSLSSTEALNTASTQILRVHRVYAAQNPEYKQYPPYNRTSEILLIAVSRVSRVVGVLNLGILRVL